MQLKEQVLLKISKEDKMYLQQLANEQRMPLSTYIRNRILTK